jgi:hypothetical protein
MDLLLAEILGMTRPSHPCRAVTTQNLLCRVMLKYRALCGSQIAGPKSQLQV